MQYIKSLDGVRALSIIFVMLFHYHGVLEIGWIGVQIFFVLSGYLITSILVESKADNYKQYFGKFYWRRSLRIFPLYFGFLIAVAFGNYIFSIIDNFGSISPYLFTYTYNLEPIFNGLSFGPFFTHFWSLSVEEQFYMIWPLIVFLLDKRALKYVIIGIIVVVPFVRLFFEYYLINTGAHELHTFGEIIYRFTLCQFDAFAIGAAITVFDLPSKVKSSGTVLALSSIFLVVIGLGNYLSLLDQGHNVSLTSLGYPIGLTANYMHVWTYTVIDLSAAFLIIFVLKHQHSGSWLNWIFSQKFMIQVGKISYGMYVFHWPLVHVFKKYVDQMVHYKVISFSLFFIATYIISYISFHYFESIFLRLKDTRFKKYNNAKSYANRL